MRRGLQGRLAAGRLILVVLGCMFLALPSPAVPGRSLLRVETRFLDAPGKEEYPEADAIVLEDDIGFQVDGDGGATYSEHDAVKVLGAEGARNHGRMDRVYDAASTSIEVLKARTVHPDGRVVDVGERGFRDVALFPGSRLYSSLHALTIVFPEVTPGSVVEFDLITRKQPLPGRHWWATSYVRNPDPMLGSRFTVRVPADLPLYYGAPGVEAARPREVVEDGVRTVKWEVPPTDGLALEPAMPDLMSLLDRIEVTSFASWDEVGRWLYAAWREAVDPGPRVAMIAAGVLPPAGNQDSRIDAILRWVAENTEASPVITDQILPHRAEEALGERLLSTLDRAVLIASMLRFAGFDVEPVWVSSQPARSLRNQLPVPDRVERLLLRLSRGTNHGWIDPEGIPELLAYPPAGAQGLGGLQAGPEGCRILELPVAPPSSNRREVEVEAKVAGSGRAELALRVRFAGITGRPWRSAAQALARIEDTEQRDRQLDELFRRVAGLFPGHPRVHERYFPLELQPGDDYEMGAVLLIAGYARRGEGSLAVPLPVYGRNRLAPFLDAGESRRFPVVLDGAFRDETRIHMVLPPGSRVSSLPDTVSVDNSVGRFLAASRSSSNEVWYYSRLVVKRPRIEAEDYPLLLELARAAEASAETVLTCTLPAEEGEGGE